MARVDLWIAVVVAVLFMGIAAGTGSKDALSQSIVKEPGAEQGIRSQGDFPGLNITRNESTQTTADLFQVFADGEKRVWIDNKGELWATNLTVEHRENVSHILGVSRLDFVNDTSELPYKEGRLYYDSVDDSLVSYIDNSQVSLNLGREMVVPVRNVEGSQLEDGDVVRVTGGVGGSDEVEVMCANNSVVSETDFLGVMTSSTENNEDGYMTIIGQVHDLDTSNFSSGDELYLGEEDCGFTSTPPEYPDYKKQIGVVTRSNAGNGVIDVDIDDEFNQGMQPGGVFYADENGVIATNNSRLRYNETSNQLILDADADVNMTGGDVKDVGTVSSDAVNTTNLTVENSTGAEKLEVNEKNVSVYGEDADRRYVQNPSGLIDKTFSEETWINTTSNHTTIVSQTISIDNFGQGDSCFARILSRRFGVSDPDTFTLDDVRLDKSSSTLEDVEMDMEYTLQGIVPPGFQFQIDTFASGCTISIDGGSVHEFKR